MQIKYVGGFWLGGKFFCVDDAEEIEYCLSKNKVPNMFTLGTDEKIVLLLGIKPMFINTPIIKTIITNKRVILRTGINRFDQYLYKNIETIKNEGFTKAFSPSIVLADGKKINLFSHMKPLAPLTARVSSTVQQQWVDNH